MKHRKLKRYREIPGKYKEIEGDEPVLLTVPHAKMPRGELYLPEIAYEISYSLNTHLLIGDVSRSIIDLNRSEADNHPFRRRIKELLLGEGIRLILDLHGMRGESLTVEIGTSDGKCAVSLTINIFVKYLKEAGFKVLVDKRFKGRKKGTIISTFCNPPYVEALQIEIAYYIRRNKELRVKLINAIEKAIKEYLNKVVRAA